MNMERAIAIDLGASSGRIIIIELENGQLSMKTVHRFENRPLHTGDGLRWDLSLLIEEIDRGLAEIDFQDGDSISVDTWGVDYVLVDNDDKIICQPFCYSDHFFICSALSQRLLLQKRPDLGERHCVYLFICHVLFSSLLISNPVIPVILLSISDNVRHS